MFTQPTQIPRSPFASMLTLLVHVCLVLVVIAMSAVPRLLPEVVDRHSLTYVAAAPPPILIFEVPPAPRVPEPPAPVELPAPEPPAVVAPVVEPPIVATPPIEVLEPIVEPPPPAPELPPTPTPPPVPQVVLGAFGEAPVTILAPERRVAFEDAGFSADAAASERERERERERKRLAVVEGFDANPQPESRSGRLAFVTDAGFGSGPAPSATQRGGPAAVADAGFTADAASGPAPGAPHTDTTPAGFTTTPPVTSRAPTRAPARRRDTPVEILHKPTPAYTDAARAGGIEGEVVIEVEFTAGGEVRVLRVVRGLGYGLDVMARRAAEQIRFTPATREGVPVDFRTTLTIVFRLT